MLRYSWYPALSRRSMKAPNASTLIPGVVVSDVDVGELVGGTIQVTVSIPAADGSLQLTAAGTAIVSGNNSGNVTVTGLLIDVNSTLNSLRYTVPNGDFNSINNGGDVVFSVGATDLGHTGIGGPLTDTETFNLSVAPTNDNPVITTPIGLGLDEAPNASRTLNGVSLSDVDINESVGSTISVTLTIPGGDGTLSAAAAGAAIVGGNNSNAVTVTGSLSDVNSTLAGLQYRVPNGDFNSLNNGGDVVVSVTANDNGNTGSGGGGNVLASFSVTVNATNDAPIASVPAAITALNEGPNAARFLTGVSVADVDVAETASGTIRVTVSVPNSSGTLDAGAAVQPQSLEIIPVHSPSMGPWWTSTTR